MAGDHEVLIKLARQVARPGMVTVEMGCRKGGFTRAIAPVVAANNGILVCVDWFRGSPSEVGQSENDPGRYSSVEVFGGLLENLAEWRDRLMVVCGESKFVADMLPNGMADLVFIDADHTYDSAMSDIQAWHWIVRHGGILCGHDCEDMIHKSSPEWGRVLEYSGEGFTRADSRHYGVIRAVVEKFGGEARCENNVWWVRV